MPKTLFIILKDNDPPIITSKESKSLLTKLNNMKTKNLIIIGIGLFFASGCKKDVSTEAVNTVKTVNPGKVFTLPSTAEQKTLVSNLGKVTDIFKELYKDKSNLKLVNASIYAKVYTDESILLKDLIYPSTSLLKNSEKFKSYTKKWSVNLETFAEKFWKEVNRKNDPAFNSFLDRIKNTDLSARSNGRATASAYGDPVSIYFPYSQEFLPEGGSYDPITSITTATADADEGVGSQPFLMNGVVQYYVSVIVNDDYAFANPTQIIGVNGIEADTSPNSPPPPPPPAPGVSRVFVGEGLCKHQYDRLISFTGNGGGSEIKYCHLSGYLQPVNYQVTTFQDIASVNFSRRDIRLKHWLRNYIVWDDDWAQGDVEQVFAIYEEDNTNTKTFNGSVGTTVTVAPGSTVNGTIGYTVSVVSQDDIIRELKISRNSYFNGSFLNQGWGFTDDATFLPLPFTHGWPRYDGNEGGGADVCWTWPYTTY